MKWIGVAGVARSGKDTFSDLIVEFCKSKGIKAKRFALADALKSDLKDFVKDKFNIDIFNMSDKEKKLIRPILVSYGCAKREQTEGRHWIDTLEKQILSENLDLAVISDIRFAEYDFDEDTWIGSLGSIVHIKRIIYGEGEVLPPNRTEEMNDPVLQDCADYRFSWVSDKESARRYAFEFLEQYPELWS